MDSKPHYYCLSPAFAAAAMVSAAFAQKPADELAKPAPARVQKMLDEQPERIVLGGDGYGDGFGHPRYTGFLAYPELLPFRRPTQNIDAPRDEFTNLQLMYNLATGPDKNRLEWRDGREFSTSKEWLAAHTKGSAGLEHISGAVLWSVMIHSENLQDRRLAYYGAFYLGSASDVVHLISAIPGEPDRALREDSYRRAIEFLRVHLAKNSESDGGAGEALDPSIDPNLQPAGFPAGSTITREIAPIRDRRGRLRPQPGMANPAYLLNTYPFFGLLQAEDSRDVTQGLWFLHQLIKIRRGFTRHVIAGAHRILPNLLVDKDPALRREARALVLSAASRPELRRLPAEDAPADVVRDWYRSVYLALFPPVRHIAEGRTEVYPDPAVDYLVAKGKQLLASDRLGVSATGKVNGMHYRGYRLQRIPPEFAHAVRLPVNAVITAVNGEPTPSAEPLLAALTRASKTGRVMVEFVADQQARAIEFVLARAR